MSVKSFKEPLGVDPRATFGSIASGLETSILEFWRWFLKFSDKIRRYFVKILCGFQTPRHIFIVNVFEIPMWNSDFLSILFLEMWKQCPCLPLSLSFSLSVCLCVFCLHISLFFREPTLTSIAIRVVNKWKCPNRVVVDVWFFHHHSMVRSSRIVEPFRSGRPKFRENVLFLLFLKVKSIRRI